MLKVGLTGNICSGYIEVAKILRNFDVPVFDADIAFKFLLNYRQDITYNVRLKFGNDIIRRGLIDPTKFNSTEKFDKLLDLAQPSVLKLYDSFRYANSKAPYTVFKSSILFERGLDSEVNYTISTFKPKDSRAMHLSKEASIRLVEAYDIIESEMDELSRNQKSTHIIHNYDNLSLLTQAKEIHDKIESKSIIKILDKTNNNYKNIFGV